MESYIIRIYRRDERNRSPSRGVVETVDTAEQESFGTMQELWRILSGKRRRRTGSTGKGQGNRKADLPGNPTRGEQS